uniref:hypothetical protein n=1 Tax=Chroodactylon ornatum TaxID=139907 RepID=UPI001FCDCCDE|nr:hypothetical protein MW609_pgp186 [Chroodactylon ornatum]UNJ14513.1 hypothetical protein [Chroodactylon ornatum]
MTEIFPLIYLSVINFLFLIFAYFLTRQCLFLYSANQSSQFLKKKDASTFESIAQNKNAYEISQIYWSKSLYLSAVEIFQFILLQPKNYSNEQLARIYHQLGLLYSLLGDDQKEMNSYYLGLDINPQSEILKQVIEMKENNKTLTIYE